MNTKKIKRRNYKVTINFSVDAETIQKGAILTREAIELMGLNVISISHISGKRSLSQNNALHLWFELIALEAERKGLTIDKWIKKPTELMITKSMLKDTFRSMGKIMFKKDSTTELTREEFSEMIFLFDKSLLERLGIDIEFPNMELLIKGKKVRK